MDPRPAEELLSIIRGFMLRGRRVLAHSLMADDPGLDVLAAGGWFLKKHAGAITVTRELPNEEILESLAARVRPTILNDDPVHHGYVLNALSALLHKTGGTDHIDWCKTLKKDWVTVDPKVGKATYYLKLTQPDHDSEELTDLGLTLSWFYGDLVHADPHQIVAGEKFGIEQRYTAAAVRTAQIAILIRDTYNYIAFLAKDGIIDLDLAEVEAVDAKVTVTDTASVEVYVGDLDQILGADKSVAEPAVPSSGPWDGVDEGTWQLSIPWGNDSAM